MNPVEIAKGIYNVGVRDWNIRDFHGYSTPVGSTYNAFLIVDEKITLIDTVKKEFTEQLISNISKIIDLKKIDYVISNHTEMDHSGGLPEIMRLIGENKPLLCSKMGLKNLSLHFSEKWNYQVVGNDEELSIGNRTLKFIETRMLHWPDSMFTLLLEDNILFSSDAFGQHYAGPAIFDDEIDDQIMYHAKKYYGNILLPYASKILKLLDSISKLGLKFTMICPDHGIIWRKNPEKIIDAYFKWSNQKPIKKAVVVYDTMWHSTEKMANAIVEGLAKEGIEAFPMILKGCDRSDIMTEIMDAKAVIVGSPTLNNNVFPTVIDFLTYMKGLKPLNKIGAAFGSYGWSGESIKQINEQLVKMKMDMVEPGLKVQYVPNDDAIKNCVEFGMQIGRKIND